MIVNKIVGAVFIIVGTVVITLRLGDDLFGVGVAGWDRVVPIVYRWPRGDDDRYRMRSSPPRSHLMGALQPSPGFRENNE